MTAWIVTIFYLLGFAAAIEAIMTARTATGATAWSISLVSFPFVALPAYLVFGRSKFEGTIDAIGRHKDEIDILVAKFHENLRPWGVPGGERFAEFDAIRKLAEMELLNANRAELLINGEATFDSILEGIARAERYVLIQFYMFHM